MLEEDLQVLGSGMNLCIITKNKLNLLVLKQVDQKKVKGMPLL